MVPLQMLLAFNHKAVEAHTENSNFGSSWGHPWKCDENKGFSFKRLISTREKLGKYQYSFKLSGKHSKDLWEEIAKSVRVLGMELNDLGGKTYLEIISWVYSTIYLLGVFLVFNLEGKKDSMMNTISKDKKQGNSFSKFVFL